VIGDYHDAGGDAGETRHRHSVGWLRSVPFAKLPESVKRKFFNPSTVASLKDATEDLHRFLKQ
jgi:hypothetical protein